MNLRIAFPLNARIESAKGCVFQKMEEILPEEKRDRLAEVREPKQTELNLSFDLTSRLCEFAPDLKFRFSLSPSEILNFARFYSGKLTSWLYQRENNENPRARNGECCGCPI